MTRVTGIPDLYERVIGCGNLRLGGVSGLVTADLRFESEMREHRVKRWLREQRGAGIV